MTFGAPGCARIRPTVATCLDEPDIGVGALERAALLDVQLQVGSEFAGVAPGGADSIRITTERADPISNAAAAGVHQVQGCRRQLTCHGAAAHKPTFFVGEVHDLECMAQGEVSIVQLLRDFDATHHANITIIVAAMWHRVRVRTHDDRG